MRIKIVFINISKGKWTARTASLKRISSTLAAALTTNNYVTSVFKKTSLAISPNAQSATPLPPHKKHKPHLSEPAKFRLKPPTGQCRCRPISMKKRAGILNIVLPLACPLKNHLVGMSFQTYSKRNTMLILWSSPKCVQKNSHGKKFANVFKSLSISLIIPAKSISNSQRHSWRNYWGLLGNPQFLKAWKKKRNRNKSAKIRNSQIRKQTQPSHQKRRRIQEQPTLWANNDEAYHYEYVKYQNIVRSSL